MAAALPNFDVDPITVVIFPGDPDHTIVNEWIFDITEQEATRFRLVQNYLQRNKKTVAEILEIAPHEMIG